MSHSKMTKRGKSHFVEGWNPSAKRFITTCVLCGAVGYNPTIEDEGFVSNEAKTVASFEHRAIRDELRRIYAPLALDALGRCPVCVKAMDDREKPLK